jgi:hypothetical protein
VDWTPIALLADWDGTVTYIDAPVKNSTQQFYRAVLFSVISMPMLQGQVSGNNIILSWPTWAQNFNLQTTTNLADPNSWTTLPDIPAIVNSQYTVTNQISGSQGFYRLIQSQ